MRKINIGEEQVAIYEAGDSIADILAIICPWRLDTGAYAHMLSHTKLLASYGIHALSFDPLWTWNSSWLIDLYTITQYIQTVHDIVTHFGNKKTFVLWHSMWWFVSMMAWMTNKNIAARWAIMSPYKNIKTKEGTQERAKKWYKVSKRDNPESVTSSTQTTVFELPYAYVEDVIPYDATPLLQQCTKPKFFVAWLQDTTIIPQKIHEAYNIAANPKILYDVDLHHDYREQTETITIVENNIRDFVENHSWLV